MVKAAGKSFQAFVSFPFALYCNSFSSSGTLNVSSFVTRQGYRESVSHSG